MAPRPTLISPSLGPRAVGGSRRLLALCLALLLLVANAATARADDLTNNLVVSGGQKTVEIVAGNAAAVTYSLVATNNDGKAGCNLANGNNGRADVRLTVPSAVTASESSPSQWLGANHFDLRECGSAGAYTVNFTSSTPGTYTISATITGRSGVSGTFTTTQATFTLKVNPATPVDTTAPTLHLPTAPVTAEATSASGATVTYAATATDNVDPNPTVSCAPASGSTFALGTTSVSCTARDAAGNTTNGSFSVTVADTTAPNLNVSSPLSVEATSAAGAVVGYEVSATDAVTSSPTITCAPASGSTFPLGTTTVDCSARDAAGNTSNGTFTVTVGDATKPVLHFSGDVTVEATGPQTDVTYLVTATDAVGIASLTCADADATPFGTTGGSFPVGTTTLTCTATDTTGNTESGSFTVTVTDTTAPALDLPDTIVREATSPDGASADFAVAATDLVDGAVPVNCSADSGSTFAIGVTTVTCEATDAAGNPASGSFDVVVQDTTAPTLSIPANLTAEATGPDGASVDYDVTASDAASTPGVVCTAGDESVALNGGQFPLGTTTVTCVATDGVGLETSGSFTVTVEDTTAPTVTVPEDVTVEATGPDGATVDFDASAVDLVDGEVEVTCTPASGSVLPLGDHEVECTATDAAGNLGRSSFTVTVQDTTAPVVTVPEVGPVAEATSANGAPVAFTATALDLVDGDVEVTCAPASGSTFPLGVTTVTCSATDGSGNTGDASFVVTVRDTTAPAVSVPTVDPVEATGPDGAVVAYSGQSAHDLVDGDVPVDCQPPSGSTFPLGDTTVTCTATDAAGNPGEGGFVVTVRDTTAPQLSLPGNLVREATGPSGAVVTFAASATDIVDGAVAVTCSPASGATFPLGTTTVHCSATDAAGNPAAGSFTVTVEDTTGPVVTVPADLTAEATGPNGANVTYSGVSAVDLVDGPVAATCTPASGGTFPLGTTTVTCTATDAAGNAGSATFKVTVRDTTAPALVLPNDQVVTATSASGRPVAFTATATDLVDGAVAVTCTPPSGSTFPLGTTTVPCSATDAAGNTATGSFTVSVRYSTSGVLQPINPDGSSVFKLNSTIPVKFRLTGDSAGVANATARLFVTKVGSGTTGTATEAISTNAPDSGNTFRHDGKDGQFIFNLATKPLGEGTYVLTIDLGDGAPQTVRIAIRK